MANIQTSTKFSLNLRDLGQAGLYAFIAGLIGFIGDFLTTWMTTNTLAVDTTQLMIGLKFAVVTGLAAIVQKFRDDNKIVITNVPTDVVESVKSKETNSTIVVKQNEVPVLNVQK